MPVVICSPAVGGPWPPGIAFAEAVERVPFELYATGLHTLQDITEIMEREGYTYQASHPRFGRTVLSYILNNRFYMGMVRFHGQTYAGKQPLAPSGPTILRDDSARHFWSSLLPLLPIVSLCR